MSDDDILAMIGEAKARLLVAEADPKPRNMRRLHRQLAKLLKAYDDKHGTDYATRSGGTDKPPPADDDDD
jgi:hypothetical protein